jgi:hypothetical protein
MKYVHKRIEYLHLVYLVSLLVIPLFLNPPVVAASIPYLKRCTDMKGGQVTRGFGREASFDSLFDESTPPTEVTKMSNQCAGANVEHDDPFEDAPTPGGIFFTDEEELGDYVSCVGKQLLLMTTNLSRTLSVERAKITNVLHAMILRSPRAGVQIMGRSKITLALYPRQQPSDRAWLWN